ncbi:hypothetical protein OROMI_022273 [Orobanche minor]
MANRDKDNEEQSSHPACAACRNQRKKCPSNCILRPHFPANKSGGFTAVHKIFGVSNVTKMMKEAKSLVERNEIAKSLYWEAAMWAQDPIGGPYGVFTRLHDEIRVLREYVNRHRLLLLQNENNFHGNTNTTTMMVNNANFNGNGGKSSEIMDSDCFTAVGAVSQRTWLQEVEPRFVIQQQQEGDIMRPFLFYSAGPPDRQFQQGVGGLNDQGNNNDCLSNNGFH